MRSFSELKKHADEYSSKYGAWGDYTDGIQQICNVLSTDEDVVLCWEGGLCSRKEGNGICRAVVAVSTKRIIVGGHQDSILKSLRTPTSLSLDIDRVNSISGARINSIPTLIIETSGDDLKISVAAGFRVDISGLVNDFSAAITKIKESRKSVPAASISIADEIRKFKDLLDSGIITQEEFDAKKKQLLGL